MENNICRLCESNNLNFLFEGKIFAKSIKYFQCKKCSYVQTESPYWLDKSYSKPINVTDTGILQRNLKNHKVIIAALVLLNKRKGNVLDNAGGNGLLVRLLRDSGVNAFWSDLYCENIFANGFEHKNAHIDLVTAFDAFEHFEFPMIKFSEMFKNSDNLLITTNLIPKKIPKPNEWWYYGLEHGQHIGFFNKKSLEYVSKKFNKFLITDGKSTHLFTSKPKLYFLWFILRKISNYTGLLKLGLKSKIISDFNLLNKEYSIK